MNILRQFAIATAALTIAIAGFRGTARAVSSDGRFFFETFDGPATGGADPLYPGITEGFFNAAGGTSVDVEAMVVDFDRQGSFFDYRVCNSGEFCAANEYRGELAVPLPPDTEYVAEVVWAVDAFPGPPTPGDANKDGSVTGADLMFDARVGDPDQTREAKGAAGHILYESLDAGAVTGLQAHAAVHGETAVAPAPQVRLRYPRTLRAVATQPIWVRPGLG